MSDTKRLRETVERYCDDEAREDLDAETFGNTVTPFTVLGLLDRIDALESALREACNIAWRFTQPAQIGISDSRELGQQIDTLRKAGT